MRRPSVMRARSTERPRRLAAVLGLLVLLTGATALAADTSTQPVPGPSPRPNILLLVAEDLSPRVGAFGDPLARTPHLDRLAAEGVRYTRVFTTAGVCAPSRAALILGRHQNATGSGHMRTASRPDGAYTSVPPMDAKAFPELLRAAGYFTYQQGKLDYQFSGPFPGSGPPSIWDVEDGSGGWSDRDAGRPFFGMVNFMVTHESGLFPPLGTWPRSGLHFVMQLAQAWYRRGFSDRVVPTDPEAVVVPAYYPDLPEIRRDIARQYDNVQVMDAQVGALLDRLEDEGLADSTIVIWTTDHGDGLPRAKRELFHAGIHVPLIIRWPDALRPTGLEPGSVDDQLISFVDLAATILCIAGVSLPAGLHGRDFLDPTAPPRSFVYAARDRIDEWTDRQRAVFDGRFKYIRSFYPDLPAGMYLAFREHLGSMRAWRAAHERGELSPAERLFFEPPGEEQLYDLLRDPDEVSNRVHDPDYAPILERMRRAYAGFTERVPDLGAIPEADLVARFRPDGRQPITPPPAFTIDPAPGGATLTILPPEPMASIEYRVGGGRWQLYTRPIRLAGGERVEARAVRYGWATSESSAYRVP